MNRLLIGLCVAIAALTATAEEPRELANNAALRYWQAIALMPTYSDNQLDVLSEPLTADLGKARELLRDAGNALRLMHRGAAIGPAAWGFDYEADGPNTLLPHLAKIRHLGMLALLRARIEFADGKPDAGITDATDVIRMARHTGNNELLLNELVEYHIENMAVDVLGANLQAMPKDAAAKLGAALDAVPPRSVIVEGMRSEKRWMVGWMRWRMKAGEEDKLAAALVATAPINAPAGKEAEARREMVEGLRKNLSATVDQLAAMYDEVIKAAGLPRAESDAAEAELVRRIEASPNVLVHMLMPTPGRARLAEFRAQARWEMLHAAIALHSGGEAAFAAVRDPFGDGPFEKADVAGGYELRSKLVDKDGKAVRLRVGGK